MTLSEFSECFGIAVDTYYCHVFDSSKKYLGHITVSVPSLGFHSTPDTYKVCQFAVKVWNQQYKTRTARYAQINKVTCDD